MTSYSQQSSREENLSPFTLNIEKMPQHTFDEIDDRLVFMKGIDHSYYYKGFSVYKTEELKWSIIKKKNDFPPFQAFFRNIEKCVKALYCKAKMAFVWNDKIGDALRRTQEHLDSKNFYAFNPSFDNGMKK